MKKILLSFFFLTAVLFAHAQLNMTFQGNLPYPGKTLANIWGYVDSSGNEYALVGTSTGLSIVDVSVPTSPVEKFTVTGPTSLWREVRTKGHYAFVTTEGGTDGLYVVNLGYLPDSIQYETWNGNGNKSY